MDLPSRGDGSPSFGFLFRGRFPAPREREEEEFPLFSETGGSVCSVVRGVGLRPDRLPEPGELTLVLLPVCFLPSFPRKTFTLWTSRPRREGVELFRVARDVFSAFTVFPPPRASLPLSRLDPRGPRRPAGRSERSSDLSGEGRSAGDFFSFSGCSPIWSPGR